MGRLSFASALSLVSALLACNEQTGTGGIEDKTGVNEVPSPDGAAGVGVGGFNLGGGNMGGGIQGMPCTTATQCDDQNPCTTDACVAMACQLTNAADDGNACTTDMCDPQSGAIQNVPVQVNDNNVCTYDVCDPATGATNPLGISVFADDFSDNAQGWALGVQWFIGSAAPSMGGLDGGNDPADDHSLTSDDSHAGTGQGQLVNPTMGPSYLTSPPINVQMFAPTESATLRFWRWLNADVTAVMTTSVEISSDGVNYSQVWASQGKVIDAPPLGTGWFEMRLDVTAAVQAARAAGQPVRVRFGFVKSASAVSVGGWNIDDLSLERALFAADADPCTTDGCIDVAMMPTAAPTPMAPIDDGDDCTVFTCVPGSDGPQQQPIPNCP